MSDAMMFMVYEIRGREIKFGREGWKTDPWMTVPDDQPMPKVGAIVQIVPPQYIGVVSDA